MRTVRASALLAGAMVALAAGPLPAQTAPVNPTDAAACAALEANDERLVCYDRLHGRPQPGKAPGPPEPGMLEGAQAPAPRHSLLDSRWELDADSKRGPFRVVAYKPIYFLPYFHTNSVNSRPASPAPGHSVATDQDIDATEAKLQLSFKTKLWQNVVGGNWSDLWFGYTQSSRWQLYNGSTSRPFRETDYEPELMLMFRTDYSFLGLDGRMAGVSLNHQSNGRSLPLSRSWNRVIFPVSLEHGKWTVTVRPWHRIREDAVKDDNPDISDYMGRADATIVYSHGEHEVAAMLRHSLRGGDRSHGAVQLDWAFPIKGPLRGHLQWFSGYGESLIDYNHRANYFGLGVSLLEWYR